MKTYQLWAAAVCLGITACSEGPAPDADAVVSDAISAANPLLEDWDTPFGAPPFDRIASEDYLPAMREAMVENNAEIDVIVANADAPTFANTIEALERSGATLSKVARVLGAVDGAHTDDVIKETSKIIAPERSKHRDNIILNKA